MPLSHIVNNVGVGKVEGTFLNLTTTSKVWAADTATPYTETLLNAGSVALTLVDPNTVAVTLGTTAPLFGAALAVSENLNGNNFPEKITVQIAGIAEMRGTTGHIAPAITFNSQPVQIAALVALLTTTVANLNSVTRGIVTNVWDTDRVDVLF